MVLCESRAEVEGAQLLEAADEEGQLRLEGGTGLAIVKRRLRNGLSSGSDHPLGVQAVGQNLRQRALADANGTFDCNVTGQFEKLGHGGREQNILLRDRTQLGK